MNTPADDLIDALGGTSKVGGLVLLPPSTVHSWRKDGIPEPRFHHLRLAYKEREAEFETKVDFDQHTDAIKENMAAAIARRLADAA